MLCGGLLSSMVQLTMVLRFFKKIIICFLALQLAFFSPFANANTSPGGWTFSAFDAVASVVSAVKNGAKATTTVAKSPVSQKIAKGIAGGVIAGVAIPLAISQLSGIALEALDWVLDPANNAIKYRPKDGSPGAPTGIIYYTSFSSTKFTSLADACNEILVNIYRNDGKHSCFATKKDAYYKDITVYAGKELHAHDGFSAPSLGTHGRFTVPTVPPDNPYKSIAIDTVADKIYDNAKTGDADSVSVVTTAVADLTKEGEYDTPLDLVKPEDKTCEAGYVKNSAGECVKDEQPKTCPAGSIKVGDSCITPPEPKEDGSCGECCEQLLEAISALSDLQTKLNQKLLDSDDKTRQELLKIQDKIDLLATDLKSANDNIIKLIDEAKKLNTTVEKLDENQELRFQKLTDTIKQANQELLDSDKITQEKLDKTNELLTQSLDEFKKTNEKLDKVNENLEKMQKCNETEFNKKVCDFVDWFQDEPTLTDEPKPPIKDIEAQNSNKIDMSGSCPAPYQINFSVFGHSQNHSISYQPLCDALEMLKPIFVGAGALSSMFILMGYSRPNSTGVNN